MRFVIFSHSVVSDWNHGNAHFLRGVSTELRNAGHDVAIFEPAEGWSRANLLRDAGESAFTDFQRVFPDIHPTLYDENRFDAAQALEGADIGIVHEWNSHHLVEQVGSYHARTPLKKLFFHDTHHRSVTDPAAMAGYDLTHYDAVLAYGGVIRDRYLQNGWAKAAHTWHEAADGRLFRPSNSQVEKEGDLVWIGNWGDGERAEELREFLIEPVKSLGLKATVYGVRYPDEALEQLASAGIEYRGWLPNYLVPEVFAKYKVTVHVPRGPYVKALPGIPTIRPFEAMACGIPLVSAPWLDSEELFRPGRDFLFARNGQEMQSQLARVLSDAELSASLIQSGLETVAARHTCAHRVNELLALAEVQ